MRKMKLNCTVNGNFVEVECHPMARLLDVIRHDLNLTGAKEGCGEGECGACGVSIDGELVNSCLVPALQAQDRDIKTIESLQENWSGLQKAFCQIGGAQCGICTPGMMMAASDLLKRYPKPNIGQIREALAGNLCRCTGYTKIFESVQQFVEGTEK
jgi:aerobic carbon-monoxide dehydrogenase small subunit